MQAQRLTLYPGGPSDLVRRGASQCGLPHQRIEDNEMNTPAAKTYTFRLPYGGLLHLARKAGFLAPRKHSYDKNKIQIETPSRNWPVPVHAPRTHAPSR